eukprot:6208288-Pleurochrysis_carterae.AAC.2
MARPRPAVCACAAFSPSQLRQDHCPQLLHSLFHCGGARHSSLRYVRLPSRADAVQPGEDDAGAKGGVHSGGVTGTACWPRKRRLFKNWRDGGTCLEPDTEGRKG